MAALEAEKAQAAAEIAAMPDTTPVALHPNLPVLYRAKVEELERLLADAGAGRGGHGGDPVDDHPDRADPAGGGRDGRRAGGRSRADPGDLRRGRTHERPPGWRAFW